MRIPFGTAAFAVALALAPAAFAADVAAPAVVVKPFTWTGHYVGINGGFGWGTTEVAYPGSGTGVTIQTSGGLFGVTVGGNKQGPNWVIGIEGDFDWANIGGTAFCPNPAFDCNSDIDWLATLRGRLGKAHGRTLYYAHAGIAFAPVAVTFAGPGVFRGTDRWRAGFAGGLGVEHAFRDNLSAKIEWLYVGLEHFVCRSPACGGVDAHIDPRANIVRLGLNWRL
jgi:outer membrane immunogenic protein